MDAFIDERQSIQISNDIRIIMDINDGWVQILDESEGTQVMLGVSEAKELSRKLTGVFLIAEKEITTEMRTNEIADTIEIAVKKLSSR